MGGENADDGDENADENHVPSYTAMPGIRSTV